MIKRNKEITQKRGGKLKPAPSIEKTKIKTPPPIKPKSK